MTAKQPNSVTMKVGKSHSQHPPATTGPPTTARRLSYPGRRIAWGLSWWPGGPADIQTDTQTKKQTDRQKISTILPSLAFLGKTLLLPNKG